MIFQNHEPIGQQNSAGRVLSAPSKKEKRRRYTSERYSPGRRSCTSESLNVAIEPQELGRAVMVL